MPIIRLERCISYLPSSTSALPFVDVELTADTIGPFKWCLKIRTADPLDTSPRTPADVYGSSDRKAWPLWMTLKHNKALLRRLHIRRAIEHILKHPYLQDITPI